MHYKASAVARAAHIPMQRLTSWMDRSVIKMGDGDVDTVSSGVPRQFSLRRLRQVALTAELVRLGLDASDAADAASVFSDQEQDGRAAGELFREGKTLLVHTEASTFVINIHDRQAFEHDMAALYGDAAAVVIVNCNAVIDRTRRALALLPSTHAPTGVVFRNGRQLHT